MEMIPLISGLTAGPLGIVHLPRMWFKARAHAVGALPAGYGHVTRGDDARLLRALGLAERAFEDYISVVAPDYQACEGWIVSHATDSSAATVEAFNAFVRAQTMPQPRLSEWSERFGTGGSFTSAARLNQLDDWDGIHRQLLAADQPRTAVIPAISSSSTGPLGIPHLARLWLKHRLHGAGRLMEGYRHGVGGFDEKLTGAIGLDPAALAAFVETEKPDYLATEAWVRANAALTPETIAAWAAEIGGFNLPEERAIERRAELGITDPNFRLGIPLNDLDDWAGLHRQLLALR
jgi:hypothetical protein